MTLVAIVMTLMMGCMAYVTVNDREQLARINYVLRERFVRGAFQDEDAWNRDRLHRIDNILRGVDENNHI